MGGVFPQPPTDSGLPDIPLPVFESVGEQLGAGFMKRFEDAPWYLKIWLALLEAAYLLIKIVMGGMDDIFAVFTKALTASQAKDQPGFKAMMAAILGDLLGMEFDETELMQTTTAGGRMKAMTKAGGWLFDTLATEFSGRTLDPTLAPLASPAKSFLGFLIEFAVRQGNVATFTELLPEEINFVRGLREYGEMLAQNLGLGRLARQALRPLMQVAVADPLQEALNNQYRPKRLSASQLIKAFKRGALSKEQVYADLAWEGYRDDRIDLLISDDEYKWHARELLELYRRGTFDNTDVTDSLASGGLDTETSTFLWEAYKGEAVIPLVREYISVAFREFRAGLMLSTELAGLIDTSPLMPEEKEWYRHILGLFTERPRKLLTESEIERAFVGGIIDMTTAQAHWQGLGYSTEAIQTLSLLLLQKQSAGNRTKAGHTPHKILTEAQAERAYNAGLIDLTQLQAYWHAMGYSPDDQVVLSALVQLKTTDTGTTQFPGLTTP